MAETPTDSKMPVTPARSARKRLTLVSLYYWPELTGNAPYVTQTAEFLATRGWDVHVITGLPHYPEWRTRPEYVRRRNHVQKVNGVSIYRFRHYVPNVPNTIRRAFYEASFIANAAFRTLPSADLVLGVVPSFGDAVLARRLARRLQVPYGLLFQDVMGRAARQAGVRGGGRVASFVTSLECRLARGAASIGVVSDTFTDYFERCGVSADRIALVPNWTHTSPSTGHREEVRADLGWSRSFVVLHAGNMGVKQDLEQVLDAARLAQDLDDDILFVLLGDGNQRPTLELAAAGLSNVRFLDPQPTERFADSLVAADILLVSQRAEVADMSLPSKLTSYFASGAPIVAAVNEEGAAARELKKAGNALVVRPRDPAALIQAIQHLQQSPELRREFGARGRRFATANLDERAGLASIEEFVTSIRTNDPATDT